MMWSRLIVPTSVLVLAAGAVASGAVGGSSDSIDGCITSTGKDKGTLRVLTGSAKCGKGETPISWNADGAKGDPGTAGSAGPAGAAGAAGAPGASGATGSQGVPGPKGDTGPAGRDGAALTAGGQPLTDGTASLYLKLQTKRAGNIKGESTDPDHLGWIQLKSAQFNLDGATALGSTAARSYGPVQLTKLTDASTTAILGAVQSNDEVKSAVIAERRAGDAFDTFTWTLTNARFTKFQQGGAQDPPMFERFAIAFTKVEATYRPRNADGSPGAAASFADEIAPVG